MNYKQDVSIDIHNLHEEWQNQSSLAGEYGEYYSDATAEREQLELKVEILSDELKEVSATIDNEIRADFKEFGFTTKPTDLGIKSKIILQDRYKNKKMEIYEKTGELISSKRKENRVKTAYYSFQDRRAALEGIVRLYLNGYYSEPRAREGKEIVNESNNADMQQKLNERMNQRNREE